ncbi:DUF2806 domain-containing protein [Lysobacter sp. SG-8]|uniref:DUF2806 domain-containing protein n=1 Tax=Marilutibacter penaei TaxID=2759900 RepID=A0A7W3U5W1_9GAMM|nr:DUF2806 domain-containing protein [Lysobacter penaei]MBB1089467.1 DUF2806 domain-containing protein [Lysobacter penaei]
MNDNADEGKGWQIAAEVVSSAVSGVPTPIQQGALKAFSRLCSALIDIPVAHLESFSEERRAITEARVDSIRATSHAISNAVEIDPQYALRISHKYARKIVGRQKNVDAVVGIAAQQLTIDAHEAQIDESDGPGERAEVSDDWLNQFEREAESAESEELRARLGKILAGEIQRPNSFSVRAVRALAQLDQETARLLQKLCSCAMTIKIPMGVGRVAEARVCSVKGDASTNGLAIFGLSFAALNRLHENGFVIPDFNSYFDFSISVAGKARACHPFEFNGSEWALVPSGETQIRTLRVNGVQLTHLARELLPIIDPIPVPEYAAQLSEYFSTRNVQMTKLMRATPPEQT